MLIVNISIKCLTEQSKLGLFPLGTMLEGFANEKFCLTIGSCVKLCSCDNHHALSPQTNPE